MHRLFFYSFYFNFYFYSVETPTFEKYSVGCYSVFFNYKKYSVLLYSVFLIFRKVLGYFYSVLAFWSKSTRLEFTQLCFSHIFEKYLIAFYSVGENSQKVLGFFYSVLTFFKKSTRFSILGFTHFSEKYSVLSTRFFNRVIEKLLGFSQPSKNWPTE